MAVAIQNPLVVDLWIQVLKSIRILLEQAERFTEMAERQEEENKRAKEDESVA